MELRQSTEIKVRIGPFLDATDGKTPETGITLGAADQAEILKANGVATVDISGATWAAVTGCDGWYDLTITTSYSDTLGHLTVVVQDDSVCLPVFGEFKVVTANYWDSKYSTDKLEVDVTQWSGTAVATPSTAGVPEVEIKPITHCATSGTVNTGSVSSGAYTDACTDDTSYWIVTESNNDIDVEFGFGLGVNRIPTNLNVVLFVSGTVSGTTNFYAYNYLTSSWDVLNYSAFGPPSQSDTKYRLSMSQDHVDTDGSVKIRVVLIGFGLTSTVSLDLVNVQSIDAGSIANGVKLGAQGKLDVNAEADTALIDYDPPTNTEMAAAFTEIKGGTWAAGTDTLEHIRNKQTDIETDTAEIGIAGAGLTDLGGMSTGMKAEVNVEADSALTDYDPPTDTEMIARTLPTADYVVTTDTIAGVTTATNLTNAPTSGDLTATMKTSVNDQVVDVIRTDTSSEMSQGAPPVDPTIEEMMAYLYFKMRNKQETTTTEDAIYDDAGTTKIFKATLSDDGTTFTKQEYGSG